MYGCNLYTHQKALAEKGERGQRSGGGVVVVGGGGGERKTYNVLTCMVLNFVFRRLR